MFISFFRDYISIVKEDGEVLNISLFSTTLGHADKSIVVIPNRKIVGEILHNYGKIRQLDVTVSVAQGTDVDVAILDELRTRFPDFVRAYEPDGLTPAEFDTFGPTVRTLRSFISSYHDLLAAVRDLMMPNPDVPPGR